MYSTTGERVVYFEELEVGKSLRIMASGEIDDLLLVGLEDFIKHKRARLASQIPTQE